MEVAVVTGVEARSAELEEVRADLERRLGAFEFIVEPKRRREANAAIERLKRRARQLETVIARHCGEHSNPTPEVPE